jgi:metal-dependent amidase/aminoacylase/carboxypeptidase family protein
MVMLRADMDALPVKEATGLPYASTAAATDPDITRIAEAGATASGAPRAPDITTTEHYPPTVNDRDRTARVAAALRGNARFAPVIHPTLETGVQAMVAAALDALGS